MNRRDLQERGWTECDIILITGDAYVDHPSFGVAMIGRWLEHLGYKVGIISQPDTRRDNDFLVMGKPLLFWGVTAGNLDSDLSALTVMRKRRRDDPYSPNGRAGARPRNASIVYTACAHHACKGVPVILGGLEASLRRFAYYDYWTDKVRRSILFDSKADLLVYGMAERAIAEVAARLKAKQGLHGIPGTAETRRTLEGVEAPEVLPAFEQVSADTEEGRTSFMLMAKSLDAHAPYPNGKRLVQQHGDRWLVVHPPTPALKPEELDTVYSLPFTRQPHPQYGRARIPAYDMIKDSVTTHRGCYGACAFCAIASHQGATIVSRSERSVLRELNTLARHPDFKGTVSDLGGPTANMYGTGCKLGRTHCPGKACLFPNVCPNLNTDPAALIRLLRAARGVQGVSHVFVSSGIRYDLALADPSDAWLKEIIAHHIGGRLKIAPEHLVEGVLKHMRKPSAKLYHAFLDRFRELQRRAGRRHDIVEYFISGHPGCTLQDMIELALVLKRARIHPEQIQDYYPAPLTLAGAMFYTGLDPHTLKPIPVARTDREKSAQRALLLFHKPEWQTKVRTVLMEAGRSDLIGTGPDCLAPPGKHFAQSGAEPQPEAGISPGTNGGDTDETPFSHADDSDTSA